MRYTPGQTKQQLIKGYSYTEGKELMNKQGKEYKGYYHEYRSNLYTGIEHNNDSELLIKYNNDKNFIDYIQLTKLNKFDIPIPYISIPTNEDYKKGYIKRYFIKKRNMNKIIEISDKQYKSISNNKGIDENIYLGFELNWKITGPIYDQYKNNILINSGIYDTNKRTVIITNNKIPNIINYFNNYLELSNVTI